jgi:hypothetical protein
LEPAQAQSSPRRRRRFYLRYRRSHGKRRRGLGIAASSENSARAELEAGKLVRVLRDWDFGPMEVNALFANDSGQGIAVTAGHSPQLLIRYLYPTRAENLTLAKHHPRPSALALEVLQALRRRMREGSEIPDDA